MSICLVQVVGFCAFAIAIHASLSLYRIDAADCGTPRSHKILQMNRIIFPEVQAPMYSASVDDSAMVGRSWILYATHPPARQRHVPIKERRVWGQAVQSLSTKPCSSRGSWEGCPSRGRLCMLLHILGGDTTSRYSLDVVRQKRTPSFFVACKYLRMCLMP
jgi:hypothetical protein